MKQLLAVVFVGVLLPGLATAQTQPSYSHPELLTETSQLAERLEDPRLRIVDVRSADLYARGHIGRAVHFDVAKLRTEDETFAYLPGPDEFSALMGELGIDNDAAVVIYDDRGGVMAARLWYVLDYYGHRRASLLNGGWNKWTEEGRMVTTVEPSPGKTTFRVNPNPQVLCTIDQVKSRIGDRGAVILDARSPQEYAGEAAQSKRGGHIPGAVNIEWRNNLTAAGTFKPADELRRLYSQAGITPNMEVVTYCQTGGRASHALFVLRLIGYDKSRNYYGSWQDWGNREDTPVEK